ncbi:hypothetical protein LR48_Vigan11g066300 [Vigna angularis]|uniref:Putative plant transposon protein domain-containing protein n=1 Tax=Phaseolus angularis TaxID=3914 RepID=A0A0L9VRD5_PHAAN|nr:hypothetical protein LR48_Vigan11g066300 [Vigna angularis]
MASSSRRRVKTIENTRKDKEPNKFLSNAHERHFLVVQDKRLLMERKVGLILALAPQFGRELERRAWENLTSYPALANVAVVREFYTNARVFDTKTQQYSSYVRESLDFADVERVLCLPGGHFQRNRQEALIHIRRFYLTPLAKYWMTFTHANVQPCSHVLDITTNRAILLYCILRGLNIDIGQVLAMEIQGCVHSVSNNAPLGHPSLITHLCEITGVKVSSTPLECPRKEIDASYYTQYCPLDEAGYPVPPPQPPRDHRGEQELLRTLTSAFPKRQFISSEDFATRVAWPVALSQIDDGAEAVEASAMEEEAKDEEDSDDYD